MAAGDAYNDTAMLAEADAGFFFRAAEHLPKEFPRFPSHKRIRNCSNASLRRANSTGSGQTNQRKSLVEGPSTRLSFQASGRSRLTPGFDELLLRSSSRAGHRPTAGRSLCPSSARCTSRKTGGHRWLGRPFAIHEHMRPGEVKFLTDVPRSIAGLREDVHTLGAAIPVVPGVRQVEVRVPELKVVILGRTELEVARRAHHVLPGLDVHIAHVDVVCREEVFERVR